MKINLVAFLLFGLSILANATDIVDKQGLLDKLDVLVGNKSFKDFQKNCDGKFIMSGYSNGAKKTRTYKFKSCDENKIVLKSRKSGLWGLFLRKKEVITKEQFNEVNGNMFRYILKKLTFNTSADDEQTENYLRIKSFNKLDFRIPSGQIIPAIKLNSELVNKIVYGIESTTAVTIIIASDTKRSFLEQVLAVNFDDDKLLEIEKIYEK